jgi:hypothetical protein
VEVALRICDKDKAAVVIELLKSEVLDAGVRAP